MKSFQIEHVAFRISIILKFLDSLIETLSGFVLLFVSSGSIYSFVSNFFAKELAEDPHDFIATHLISLAGNFPSSVKLFVALYFISHGVIKLGLLIGLWYEKIKLYPVAIGIFILFIIYQIYKYIISPSGWLIYLTVLDLIFIGLAILEYRHLKRGLIK
ncbi:MAG: DUF2127 domain-containing protein [Candidatus Pacearchaeota archaeon]|nr:DUF2127 domain-containing protein [Candidatus Pacearchaeota archaeon]